MTVDDAYHEGHKAFYRGDLPTQNPFDTDDEQYDEWEKGYLDADAAESGEFE